MPTGFKQFHVFAAPLNPVPVESTDSQFKFQRFIAKREAADQPLTEEMKRLTEWAKAEEKKEFDRTNEAFKPLAEAMAARFVKSGEVPVSATNPNELKKARTVVDWWPENLLCKRFNIKNPYFGQTKPEEVKSHWAEDLSLPRAMIDAIAPVRPQPVAMPPPPLPSTALPDHVRQTIQDILDHGQDEYVPPEESRPPLDLFKEIFAVVNEPEPAPEPAAAVRTGKHGDVMSLFDSIITGQPEPSPPEITAPGPAQVPVPRWEDVPDEGPAPDPAPAPAPAATADLRPLRNTWVPTSESSVAISKALAATRQRELEWVERSSAAKKTKKKDKKAKKVKKSRKKEEKKRKR